MITVDLALLQYHLWVHRPILNRRKRTTDFSETPSTANPYTYAGHAGYSRGYIKTSPKDVCRRHLKQTGGPSGPYCEYNSLKNTRLFFNFGIIRFKPAWPVLIDRTSRRTICAKSARGKLLRYKGSDRPSLFHRDDNL